jgi:predicted DCC family thiol-disulfide oxidoreductase YuxK
MNRAAMLVLAAPAVVLAAGPFDGVWKIRTGDLGTSRPFSYSLADGHYECSSCLPSYRIAADGKLHAVKGQQDYDQVAVRAVDAHTVRFTYKKEGKTVYTESDTVSADGSQLRATQRILKGKEAFNASVRLVRASAAAEGAHALSGTWRMQQTRAISAAGRTFTYESTADGLRMQWNGQSYDAKFDGQFYPQVGDPTNSRVSLKKIDARTIEQSVKQGEDVVELYRMTVAEDGKTMSVVDTNVARNRSVTFVLDREP